jgi:hypothetical protein
MVLSYITNMISFDQPPQYEGADIDEELTLPIQMPEQSASAPATVSKHHIISIIDFMRHSRRTHIHEHRISMPTISRL